MEKKAFAYRVHIGDYNYLQCIHEFIFIFHQCSSGQNFQPQIQILNAQCHMHFLYPNVSISLVRN
jgi:hypothetical protein